MLQCFALYLSHEISCRHQKTLQVSVCYSQCDSVIEYVWHFIIYHPLSTEFFLLFHYLLILWSLLPHLKREKTVIGIFF